MVFMMAPGGTMEMARTVLDEGADATYVGVRGWSRRGAQDELNDDEIHEIIDYAVDRNREVRIVVNTYPSSTEIPMFLEKVRRYRSWGAKGFMISDPGCMRLVHDHVPDADIHTSVGCGITNFEDVRFLREMGATYVVLPYRMSIAEVAEIKREGGVGIEVFLFKTASGGKICPGKCMMSSYFSFRRWLDAEGKDYFFGSASRGGDCLRVCQADWNFGVDQGPVRQHLTIKTNPALWLIELPGYLEAGVDCLKVPGRDRSPKLVGDLVRFYRRVIDEILSSDHPNLEKFLREVEGFRHRWIVERSKRDNRLVSEAESVSRKAIFARA
jgi:putative protease